MTGARSSSPWHVWRGRGPRFVPALCTALLAGVFVTIACGPRAGGRTATVPPASDAAAKDRTDPLEPHEGETAPELIERMRRFRDKQGQYLPASSSDPDACEYVCSLATSICGVKEKLCRLADERPGDETYQQYCREAKLACRNAQDNCVACVEAFDAERGG